MGSGNNNEISSQRRRTIGRLAPATIAFAAILAGCGSGDAATESGTSAPEETTTSQEATEPTEADSEPATTAADAQDETAGTDADAQDEAAGELFPDVLEAVASQDDDGSWTFDVTLSSPYDTPHRYADAWRVVGPDGEEYGIRVLTHDHAAEQPFTRSQSGIAIPDDVDEVTVEGRDQVSGWGGATVVVTLER